MATIQLGTVITNIAGSVGGQTFRRNGNTITLANKTKGVSRNATLQNLALFQIRQFAQNWNKLSQDDKRIWGTYSTYFLFPDKFGNQRSLSGRMFYIKIQGWNNAIPRTQLDPSEITSFTDNLYLTNFNINTALNAINLTVAGGTDANYILIQAEIFTKNIKAEKFTRRKIIFVAQIFAPYMYNIYDEVLAQFPNLKIGDYLRIYISSQNSKGFRTPCMAYLQQVQV